MPARPSCLCGVLESTVLSGNAMMPTQNADKQSKDQEKQSRVERKALIAKQVLLSLGRPQDLHRVQVRNLWEDHYRVNVLLGIDATNAKIGHSYFLVADGDGNILASTPKIVKHYEPK
jgi:hypothetical protein